MSSNLLVSASSRALSIDPLAILSWVLLVVWLGSSAATLWSMELRDTRPDELDTLAVEDWYRSNAESLSQAGAPFKVTLVHVYHPDCRCNRLTDPDLKRLVEVFRPRGVRFAAAPLLALDAGTTTPSQLPSLSAKRDTLAAAGVKSSPTALIFDANGRLMYYGPYSDSAQCGSTGNLVDPALDRALSGLATVRRPRAARGCSCGT